MLDAFLLTAALSAQVPLLPDCSDPELGPRAACVLDTGDGTGWRLAFDFSPEGARARSATVLVVSVDGLPVQSLTYPLSRSVLPPQLADLDADGLEDLILPLSTDWVNSRWAIAFGSGDGFAATSGDPILAYRLSPVEPGLFSAHAHDTSGRRTVTFHVRDGLALPVEAVAAVTVLDDGERCALISADAPRDEPFYCSAALSP